ncbi:hypothetical protein [Streptomyces sp. NPDC056401]|uniref:hypothetical protein n=1 Tax=Streptomyces TaxID=1883 RepID=UPI0035D97715
MSLRNEKGFKGARLVGAQVDDTEKARIAAAATGKLVVKNVTVNAGSPTGTVTVVAGSVPIGIVPSGNQDQYVDNVAVSATTLTVTLAANATANNTFKVTVLEP